MRLINIDDFTNWLNADSERDLTYSQKAVIKNVINDYADKYGSEVVNKQRELEKYENWLDKNIGWSKDDISKGLPTRIYNALLRANRYDKEKCAWVSFYITNRDLENASDEMLMRHRLITKNTVEKIREYLKVNKENLSEKIIDVGLRPLGGADIDGNEYKICRKCSAIVQDGEWKAKYCPECGKKVNWDGENNESK